MTGNKDVNKPLIFGQTLKQFGREVYASVGNKELEFARLIARDVRDWKSYQQSVAKAAPSTINQRLVALSSFYKWGLANDRLTGDPTAGIAAIRLAARRPQSLTTKDLRRLLRAVHNGGSPRDAAIVELLAGAGLRVGELLQLQRGDIVVDERAGRVIVREGKHAGYREIPLTRDVRQAVSAWLAVHPAGATAGPQTPLWAGRRGALAHRSSILRVLQKYAYRAQLGDISPHILCHTFAAHYLQANPDDLRGLAALLGHSDLNTVMIYTEPSRQDLAERLERMGRAAVG